MEQILSREVTFSGGDGDAFPLALKSGVDHLEGCACGECGSSKDFAPGPGEAAEDVVPGDTSSTASVAVGGYVSGVIDFNGDHDWYAVTLVAGQTYTFQTILTGSGLPDSLLVLRSAAGVQLATNDDAASAPNHYTFSEITFTATATGTYFLDVSGFDVTDVGSFYLTVSAPAADAIAASSATTASLTLGTATNGLFDANGDHDWYAVTLTAGQSYVFNTSATGGAGDPDTTLFLRNASGALLSYNDDGVGSYSQIRFTPTTTGTYYLDVAVWGNAGTGAYRVTADVAPPLPIFTNNEIAFQLTNTYWGGTARKWAVSPGGTLTVNITALTAEGQFLAREALNLWTDATGINFNEVALGGQITFDDNQAGAFAQSTRIGGTITASTINVSESWLTTSGNTLRSYTFQAYVHEIGHALGLGHGGNYNTTADYPANASYQNDSWATTVMSYFDQTENTYFAGLGFTRQFAVTPMIADLIAVQNLYGVNTTTRTGNTTYGTNNNSGREVFTFALGQPSTSYVIVDNGGIDTLDYSASSSNQRIDLNPETFSNVGGRVGNVSIARGTVIENAKGGNGADTLIGNAVDNQLEGGPGDDTFSGGGGNDIIIGGGGSDTIDGGGGTGDEARYSGNQASYLVESLGGNQYRVTGQGAAAGDGVDILSNIEFLQFGDFRVNLGAPTNNRPVLGSPALPDQTTGDSALYSFQVPATSFTDPDAGDVLTYSATLGDGSPLPAWLSFNAATRTFSGTPPIAAIGAVLQVKVTATDNAPGDPGSLVSDIFALTITQSPGGDIVGTSGNDNLAGTFRSERIFGLDGNDLLGASDGADQFDGGIGTDTVDYSAGGVAVTVNLLDGTGSGGQAAGDQYVSIEGVRGTALSDTLIGSDEADSLDGRGGVDTLSGNAGNDRLTIGSGSSGSLVDGGTEIDTLVIGGSASSLNSLTGIEVLELVGGASLTLTGTQARDGLALNTAVSGTGSLVINMDPGVAALTKLFVFSGGGVSVTINGTSGTDLMKLGNVAHTANGGDGIDQIKGGSAVDTINGGNGNDKINGAAGADILTGGAGNDVFKYANTIDSGLGAASDRITDFTIGQDRLNFVRIDADAVTAGDQAFTFLGTAAFATTGLGQLRYLTSGSDLIVQADVNGDGVADMEVVLQGIGGQVLAGADFVL
jgi:Ca2+-binding RTX toxin-like protein